MSTRALIKFEDNDSNSKIVIYKHYDGYPSATYNWLLDFNSKFAKERGSDPAYKVAQLLRSSIADAKEYRLNESKFTGWGIYADVKPINAGQEWEYLLKIDGSVVCRRGYGKELQEKPWRRPTPEELQR